MACTIGVDPGQGGAIAVLDESGLILVIHDMPVAGKGISAQLVADLEDWADPRFGTVVIEDVHSMPAQGVASSFKFGRAKGLVEGVFAQARRPIVYVSPQKWKGQLGLTKDKGACRQRAVEMWPHQAGLFKRVLDDGRAEAALIAYWQFLQGHRS